jgi:phosphoribosylanthranilate isomerase
MPMSVKVKICGLTNKDDATWAINYGADYLGVNFYKESPRHVSVPTAVKWVPQLPPFVPVIGVFVDETNENILKAIDKLNLKGVQLHGNETVEQIAALRIEIEQQAKRQRGVVRVRASVDVFSRGVVRIGVLARMVGAQLTVAVQRDQSGKFVEL